ncbi:P-loop containing nucleoside triphosphate hydrolase protein [Mycena maculata]|uniref:P-loop containing nucleoside triphosphate hydrolase protein n=1 Tax=Mycena maculata TaxID=230809 RepID=A0AAD7K7S4_9AGAR|nr:P-loop containing nucleoside triphosphate hydrolase protein [Mycena maculata]
MTMILEGDNVSPTAVLVYFRANVGPWSLRRAVHDRLVSFGAPSEDATKLLAAFARDATQGVFDSPDARDKYGLMKLCNTDEIDSDIVFSNIFFRWLDERKPIRGVHPETTALLLRLAAAATRLHPAEDFRAARSLRRKVIMHVGPTNSGKTHHALRALAAANAGVYAGPLRLLAHEIWERMNLGQIVPLGATEEQIAAAAKHPPGVDHPFARRCNMLTGEEQKIVAVEAPINSCTVEMLFLSSHLDVAVVDEIQMITDPERGFAWTSAVLGLCATELHLCGEETVVPVIEALLKETGDELIVNRYKRLTPLEVEKSSLEGDFSRVRPGDAIVAFSRSAIFALKRQVESKTDMKCAVVYGKLPPEIRSEQAALFNDRETGYDVLIGSDAIGMGLNLKIRRIIFEAVAKWEGHANGFRPLSISQTKQIAGRAGRFGMQGSDEKPGGFVTTINAEDISFVRKTLTVAPSPHVYARIGPSKEDLARISSLLPPNSGTATIFLASLHAGSLPAYCRPALPPKLEEMCGILDEYGQLTLPDRMQLMQAPFPWRDRTANDAVVEFIATYYDTMRVDVVDVMRKLGYVEILDTAEHAMNSPEGRTPDGHKFNASQQLQVLETFHKILVVYLWLTFRNPVSYPSHDDATSLKERLERVLHWCLQEVTLHRGPRLALVRPAKLIDFKSKREHAMEQQELMAQAKL